MRICGLGTIPPPMAKFAKYRAFVSLGHERMREQVVKQYRKVRKVYGELDWMMEVLIEDVDSISERDKLWKAKRHVEGRLDRLGKDLGLTDP